MSKGTLWFDLTTKHPNWRNPQEKVTLTAAGIKTLVELSYKRGAKEGFDKGLDFKNNHPGKKADNPFDIFSDVFSKK